MSITTNLSDPVKMDKTQKKLTDQEKAAIFLVSLGIDVASGIMKNMCSEKIENLTFEIARLGEVTPQQRRDVLREFLPRLTHKQMYERGGLGFVKRVLSSSVGKNRARSILTRLTQEGEIPFDSLNKMKPKKLIRFIRNEQPQTIALVLSCLDVEKSALVLSALPGEIQASVIMKIVMLDSVVPEVAARVEDVITRQMGEQKGYDAEFQGGTGKAAEILSCLEEQAEQAIMEHIGKERADIYKSINNMRFNFNDIDRINSRAMQMVLKEAGGKTMALALKTSPEVLKENILEKISRRDAKIIRAEMDALKTVLCEDIRDARHRIERTVCRFKEDDVIIMDEN